MTVCSIIQCTARSYRERLKHKLTFHRFPKNDILRQTWIELIGADNLKSHKALYICCVHFEDAAFNRTLDVVRLRDNAVPTKYLPSSSEPELPYAYESYGQTESVTAMTALEGHKRDGDPLTPSSTSEEHSESSLVTLSHDQIEHNYSTRAQNGTDLQNNPDEVRDDAPQAVSISVTPDLPTKSMFEEKSCPPGTDLDRYPKLVSVSTIRTVHSHSQGHKHVRDLDRYPKLATVSKMGPVVSHSQSYKDKKKIEKLQRICRTQRRKIKTLSQKVKRQEQKIIYLQDAITDICQNE